jgi:stage V sporulation protein B
MKKQSFIYGSMVLILSVIITKAIGAVFRIPLANLLGGVGMGYYAAAYGVFMPVYAVTAAGLPSAVAKVVAENVSLGRFNNLRKIKRVALWAFTGAGAVFTALSVPAAFLFCKLSDNPDALLAVLSILPSILFGSVACVLRGYYEGLRNMHPTAVSQVIEAMVKLALGLILTLFVLRMPDAQFAEMFGTLSSGSLSRLSVAAAAAVAGVTISTVLSVVFLALRSLKSDEFPENFSEPPVESAKNILQPLLKTAVPIALGALVTNLTSLIDLSTTIPALKAAIARSVTAFEPLIEAGIPENELAPFIFGSFTGLAVTVFTLIPSLTNMFGKSALPIISGAAIANGGGEKNITAENAANVLYTVGLIAVPGGIGIAALSKEILSFLFPARAVEIMVCTVPLSVLGLAVIFLCLSTAVFTVLQGIGKAHIPLYIMGAGVAVKLILNLFLVRIPAIGITGASVSTLVCYLLIYICSLRAYKKYVGSTRKIHSVLFTIALAGSICGIAARSASTFLHIESPVLSLFVSISIGGIIYAAIIFLTERKLLMKTLFA